ncbi:MAG: UDP-N-acetylmuramate dehydrogenase [Alcaligenaceae bacterium]|nr:MAG: UDP-N-acetylmuramate dehydrogenase [Alcaligenaceae bacterium]
MSTLSPHFPSDDAAVRAQDLSMFNTLGLPAHARSYVSLTRLDTLPAITQRVHEHERVCVLGGGSNVVLPRQVESLVVHIGLTGISPVSSTPDGLFISAAAGEGWHGFVRHCVEVGFYGLENLALIPGQVGAAPVQNIGAYGLEVAQCLHTITAWDLTRSEMVVLSADDCDFDYRDSRFKREPGRWIIVSVTFCVPHAWQPRLDYPDLQRHPALSQADKVTPRDVFDAVCDIRRSKLPDPTVIGNAGSFFKNPVIDATQWANLRSRFPNMVSYALPDGRFKLAAGWLIDQAGWKGRHLGRAAVHDRQALVLTNAGGADANDILALASAIQSEVFLRYGVHLEAEPILVR